MCVSNSSTDDRSRTIGLILHGEELRGESSRDADVDACVASALRRDAVNQTLYNHTYRIGWIVINCARIDSPLTSWKELDELLYFTFHLFVSLGFNLSGSVVLRAQMSSR